MGFVVLSLPILALLLIVAIAVILARVASRRQSTPKKKWITGLITVLVVILVIAWDEIGGRLYFEYLCASRGGAKIYKRVKLPPEFWKADGTPVFIDNRGNKIRSKLDDKNEFTSESTENISTVFRLKRLVYRVQDRGTREVLGTYTIFFFFGGWLQSYTSLTVAGNHCPDERGFYSQFLGEIFVR